MAQEVPWNPDSGNKGDDYLFTGPDREELTYPTDILTDPGATHSVADPAVGYETTTPRVSEV